jgi:hypothetical protein
MRTMCPDAERLVKRLAARAILPAVPATMLARDPRKNKIAEASTRPGDRPNSMPDNWTARQFGVPTFVPTLRLAGASWRSAQCSKHAETQGDCSSELTSATSC